MVKKYILTLLFVLTAILAVSGNVLAFQGFDDEIELTDGDEFSNDPLKPAPEGLPEDEPELPEMDSEPFDPASITDPNELLRIADEKYFNRKGIRESFWETQGYVNEVIDGDIIHQYYIRSGMASDMLMSMFPAEKSTRISNSRLNFTHGWHEEYHVTFSVMRGEDYPTGSGGCWLKYSNIMTKTRGRETGLILFPGKEAYGITPSENGGDLIYTYAADLSDLNLNDMIKFDFIRLGGVTYIYANDTFLFSYDDGFKGKMSFEAGSELYEGGNRVRCDFDNFIMWYR